MIKFSIFRSSSPPAGGGRAGKFRDMFVYALYNEKHDKIYIGQCSNLITRLNLHEDKTIPKSYTARFDGSWVLIYKEEVQDRKTALLREKQLKSYRGREFIKQFI